MLDFLFKLTGAVVYRIVQEYKAIEEELEVVSLGLMDDGTLGPDDPTDDVYCSQMGFSMQAGKLRLDKED